LLAPAAPALPATPASPAEPVVPAAAPPVPAAPDGALVDGVCVQSSRTNAPVSAYSTVAARRRFPLITRGRYHPGNRMERKPSATCHIVSGDFAFSVIAALVAAARSSGVCFS